MRLAIEGHALGIAHVIPETDSIALLRLACLTPAASLSFATPGCTAARHGRSGYANCREELPDLVGQPIVFSQ